MDELIYFIQKFLTFIPVPFLSLVNISITAGWIVLAVLLIRFLFQKEFFGWILPPGNIFRKEKAPKEVIKRPWGTIIEHN